MKHRSKCPGSGRMLLPGILVALAAGACVTGDARLAELQQENEDLRAELQRMQALDTPQADLRTMPAFTVGLAAAEREFDSGEFEKLLLESLGNAATGGRASVARETDVREIAKVRGMLLQQYLAAAEIPVRIENLTFKLQDRDNEFKIGDRVVARSEVEIVPADTGSAVRVVHRAPLSAVMSRGAQGGYYVPYEELGGGSGRIPIQTSDAEILETQQNQRSARQGDISFNWSLDLKEVVAYRIEGFSGDVARFLDNMRYSGIESPIAQYQTMRDAVFLFGYGRYVTSVVNQIRTPAQIDGVEVVAIDQQAFEALQGRLTEQELLDIASQSRWIECEFVDFADEEKIWKRPASVPFPFVSRQVSGEEGQVFYLKYSSRGAFFIGDYEK